MDQAQLKELLLQALTHERGGVLIYRTALECASNDDLRREWTEYLAQTERHVTVLTGVCEAFGLDPGEKTPGCQVVEHTGKALAQAMKMALAAGDRDAAQLVACDCVVLAETKDHANWALLSDCAEALEGKRATILKDAVDAVEDEEDEHLYHTKGWCRELWLDALGLDAELPPPEEERDVRTAAAAAKVEAQRAAAHKA
jgi:hypothetical protein